MESLREIVDSTRISRHLKSIQIGIVSGFTIFKSSTPNKFPARILESSYCLSFLRFLFLRTESKRSHRIPRRISLVHTRGSTCAYKEGTSGASERARQKRAKGNRGDRAIDKTPNAARPRLILQAYTHPLVFSLSSPTTHPLDHYPLPPSPPPPLLSSPAPASFSATLRTPLTLCKSPSYPLRVRPPPLSLNTTHPLRGNPRTLGAADILYLSFLSSLGPFISFPPYAFSRSPSSFLCLS